jgi:hypothetical protein
VLQFLSYDRNADRVQTPPGFQPVVLQFDSYYIRNTTRYLDTTRLSAGGTLISTKADTNVKAPQ